MDALDATPERLEALEARAMHQDRLIEDLHAALTAQWRIIDALERQVARLDERMEEAGTASGPAAPEMPPPHY